MPSQTPSAANPADRNASPAPSYDLLGVGMSILTIPDAVERILAAVKAGQQGYVCVTGMHGIMEARDDAGLQKILNHAFLCTPDGMPTVWLGRAKGHYMERVYGPDLTLALMEATRNLPIRHFFYGGAEGVAEDLKRKMLERFPGLQIVGTYCPPFRPLDESEKQALCRMVEESGADVVWVGLSTPKQERFMAEFLPRLPVKIMLGVGAAFDFHTGRARQAPRWMMHAGLEWFFRLVTEPRRLWRRYVIQVPRFASLVILDYFGLVSHSSEFPEMPPAFLRARFGYKLVPLLALFWLLTAGVLAFHMGARQALPVIGWSLIPVLLTGFAYFMLHVQSEEERLDRLGPIAALLLFYWQAFVAMLFAILVPAGLVLNGPFWASLASRFAGLASAIPVACYVASLLAVGVIANRASYSSSKQTKCSG